MSLNNAMRDVVNTVPECLAAGYIDLSTGMLLAYKTVDSHPQEVIELLAATTSDLFQGSNVTTIENIFKKIRGTEDDPEHYVREIVMTSKNLIHVFVRGKKVQDQILVVVTRVSANLGMVLTKSRQQAAAVEAVAN